MSAESEAPGELGIEPGFEEGETTGPGDPRRALVRGGTVRLASYGAIVGMSVLSASLLTRHLGLARFGDYTTVTSLVAVVAAITDSGMSNIGTREYATLHGPARTRLLADLLGLRITLTVLGIALVTVWSVAIGLDPPLVVGAVAASLATVSLVIQHTFTIPLTADLRLGWLSLLEMLRQAITVAAIVVLVVLHAGVLPLLCTTLVANTVVILPSALLGRGRISLRPAFRTARWRALMGATVAFSLATAVGIIYVYAAQILTHIVSSRYQSGLFSVSFRVFIVAAGVPALLVGSALPVLSRAALHDRDQLNYVLQRIFEAALIGGAGVAIALSSGSGFIVAVIGGRGAAAAGPVLEIQAFALIASFLTAGWGFALLSLREHRGLLIANAIAFGVSVVATLVLARQDGAQGAAIATICGESSLGACSLVALLAHHPEHRPHLAVLWKVVLAAIPAAAVGFLAPLPSLVRAILAILVYAIVILLTRAPPPEFRALLPDRLHLR